jgi:hypothetical protein
MTPQTHIAPHAHLTSAQMEALLASASAAPFSAIIPSIAAVADNAAISTNAATENAATENAATERNAVILAQPESPYLPSYLSSSQPYPSPLAAAQAHLLLCPACAAELANLRHSLSLFRQASTVHAGRELNNLAPLSLPNRSLLFPALQPAHWFAVAATLLVALLPLQTLRPHAMQSAAAITSDSAPSPSELQSDAALLDDVDREASASVPTSMQALADPTATGDTDADTASIQAPDQSPDLTPPAQRKD